MYHSMISILHFVGLINVIVCKWIPALDLGIRTGNEAVNLEDSSKKESFIDYIDKRITTAGRPSFKECRLDDSLKIDCGYYGITEDKCYFRQCCWRKTRTPGVPWCYHSKSTISQECNMHTEERMECGFYGIKKDQCLQSGCCWQPTNENGVAWCFHQKKAPVQAGECGNPAISPFVGGRIVGGKTAYPYSWPWQVSVQNEEGHWCGGSIINDRWIVSAAHCHGWDRLVRIVAGIHNKEEQSASRQEIEIEGDPIVHEDYREDIQNLNLHNDIMLLKLKTPLKFTDEVSPICLPDPYEEFEPGLKCFTTGWGDLEQGTYQGSEDLQQVMVPIISTENCNSKDWYNNKIEDYMLCAGYEEGRRDACQGDSGGPFVCLHEDQWKLVGIVSWGYGCADEKKPGVYAKTSRFVKWINDKIAKD